jgi:uncharacterized protein YacL
MTDREQKKYNKMLTTFTKRAVFAILIVALIDMQLSYILAFMGREQIAESLSTSIASTVIAVMLGYFMKALFETFFEKREERLRKDKINTEENTNG